MHVVREAVLESKRVQYRQIALVGLDQKLSGGALHGHFAVASLVRAFQLHGQCDLAEVVVRRNDSNDPPCHQVLAGPRHG